MECGEFQKNIQPFINGKLNRLKEEEMLEHLLTCDECNEELEIYYTIINCVKELDGKLETSDNYHGEYNEFIEKSRREIKKYKKNRLKRRIAFPGVVGATVLFTGLSLNLEPEGLTGEKVESRTFIENDLSMRFRFNDSNILSDPYSNIDELAKEIENRRKLHEK